MFNVALSALMVALGILSVIDYDFTSVDELATAFLPFYMILFGLMLFFYEIMYWIPFPAVNRTFRRNFGFLYGLRGKGFFLIFIAFLCLGLIDDESGSGFEYLDWITGIAWLAGGVLHIFIVWFLPDIRDAYKAPIAGLNINTSATSNTQDHVI
jgi:hypothetical protein